MERKTLLIASLLFIATASWSQYYNRSLNDFEDIQYANFRSDVTLGPLANAFMGNVGNTLGGGAGFGVNIMMYGGNGWGGGVVTDIFGYHQMQEYSSLGINPGRASRLMLFSGAIGKIFNPDAPRQFALQFEGGFGTLDFSKPDATFGATKVVARGFVPGVTASYMIPLGPGRMGAHYWTPAATRFFLDFHLSARQLMMNEKDVQGTMIKAGVALRISTRPVVDFRLRN